MEIKNLFFQHVTPRNVVVKTGFLNIVWVQKISWARSKYLQEQSTISTKLQLLQLEICNSHVEQ